RAQLFVLGPDKFVLLLLLHHMIGDGWSLTPLTCDLETAYNARLNGEAPAWEPLSIQYADYTVWQEHLLGHESNPDSLIAKQLGYWSKALEHLPDQLELPTDHPRPSESSYRGGTIDLSIDEQLHGRLLGLSRSTGVSMFMILQSALASLLTRLGAGHDIPLGSPIAGRNDDALGGIVGLFVNTLVLRTDTSGNPCFRELL
ncbi:condensation domain-containing protein, partial [Bacillus licheniformis]|uniref:condensation domain-containing protein n=1 Tax=Bacillus licheniformis TaxID=1402 RepID=UPI00237CF3F6